MSDGPVVQPAEARRRILRLPDAVLDGYVTYVTSGDLGNFGIAPTRAKGFEKISAGNAPYKVDVAEDWAFRVPPRWLHNDRRPKDPNAFVGMCVFLEPSDDCDPVDIEEWTHVEITEVTPYAVNGRGRYIVHYGRLVNKPEELAAYYRKVYGDVLRAGGRLQSSAAKGRITALLNKFSTEEIVRQSTAVWVNHAEDAGGPDDVIEEVLSDDGEVPTSVSVTSRNAARESTKA